MKSNTNPALERYAELMIERIKEVNAADWEKPWFTPTFKGAPQNLSGRLYNNFNKTLLYFVCDISGFQTPIFVTFNQATKENLRILKGSKSFPVTFYDLYIKNKDTGEIISRDIYNTLSSNEQQLYKVTPIQKYYNVFNLDQTNYAEQFPEKWEQLKESFEVSTMPTDGYSNKYVDQAIDNQKWYCPITLEKQDRAFYSSKTDSITLPIKEQFPNGMEFYYTALHEMAHSTGHSERLAREYGFFGTPKYAREELVAEFSSAVAGRDLGMLVLPRKENAQYLKSWLSGISDDPKYLMGILSDVNKAVTMIEEGIGLNKLHDTATEQRQTDIPVMTEDEYIASKGYGSSLYSESAKQQDKLLNIQIGKSNKYITERNAAKEDYQRMLNNGEIRQPTRTERIIQAANGHPDLESTQAARRIALAQRISWQPGKDNLPAICQYYYDQSQQLHAKFYQDGEICNRFVWENGNNYILCTGSRSGGNYVEHILPPEEILQIKKLCKEIELNSSGCRSLIGEIEEGSRINNYHIKDKSTGKTEPLKTGDIDLSTQSPESIEKLLSGKKIEMATKTGEIKLINLSKSPTGWKLIAEKQSLHTNDYEINI